MFENSKAGTNDLTFSRVIAVQHWQGEVACAIRQKWRSALANTSTMNLTFIPLPLKLGLRLAWEEGMSKMRWHNQPHLCATHGARTRGKHRDGEIRFLLLCSINRL